jgi:hypothetical protein
VKRTLTFFPLSVLIGILILANPANAFGVDTSWNNPADISPPSSDPVSPPKLVSNSSGERAAIWLENSGSPNFVNHVWASTYDVALGQWHNVQLTSPSNDQEGVDSWDIAAAGDGEFVARWNSNLNNETLLHSRTFTHNVWTPLATQTIDSSGSTGLHLSSNSAGIVVATWVSSWFNQDQGQSEKVVFFSQYSNGTWGNYVPIRGPFSDIDERDVAISVAENGSILVTWGTQAPGEEGVYAYFRPQEDLPWEQLDNPFNTYGSEPKILASANGDYVVYWHSSISQAILSRTFNNQTHDWNSLATVSSSVEAAYSRMIQDSSGRLISVWFEMLDNSYRAVLRASYSEDGGNNWIVMPSSISPETDADNMELVIDHCGTTTVVWGAIDPMVSSSVYSSQLSLGGTEWTSPQLLSGTDPVWSGYTKAVVAPSGEITVVWPLYPSGIRWNGSGATTCAEAPLGGNGDGDPSGSEAAELAQTGAPSNALNTGIASVVLLMFAGLVLISVRRRTS